MWNGGGPGVGLELPRGVRARPPPIRLGSGWHWFETGSVVVSF